MELTDGHDERGEHAMLLLGDIHGEFDEVITLADEHALKGETILQVGDFGLGFAPLRHELALLARLDHALAARAVTLYAIRGNHDRPDYFQEGSPFAALSHIHLVPDYTLLDLEGRKVLCVGGAVSIDRTARTAGADFWPDEPFVPHHAHRPTLDLTDLWMVVTHTAPREAPPFTLSPLVYAWTGDDHSLLGDLVRERDHVSALFDAICREASPRHWCYGHFHEHATYTCATPQADSLTFHLLDIGELLQLRVD
jgi:hypothetical protein